MMMGVITACVGGIIRDVLAGEPSILLKPEIYVTAAALASGLFGLSLFIGLPVLPAAIFSAAAGFALRAMAISSLPASMADRTGPWPGRAGTWSGRRPSRL
jgi:uncharacterized membrane protein YeiH